MKRLFWLSLGFVMVGLGVIGALLPVMPTTIFLIMAVGCFARSSPTLEAKLLSHPRYGPALRAWAEERAISRRGKRFATLGITFGAVCFWIGARPSWTLGLSVCGAMALCALWIQTRPLPRNETPARERSELATKLFAFAVSCGAHLLALYLILADWTSPPQPANLDSVRVQLTFLPPRAPPTPVAEEVAPEKEETPQRKPETKQAQTPQVTRLPVNITAERAIDVPAEVPPAQDGPTSPSSSEAQVVVTAAPQAISLPPSPQFSGEVDPNWEGEVLMRLEQFKRYPRPARVRKQEGIVMVHAQIGSLGQVLSVKVQNSSGSALLDREALETFARAQPLPPPPATMAMPVSLDVPVKFFLQ